MSRKDEKNSINPAQLREKAGGKAMLLRVIRDTIPVMTGYVVLGIGFGILLKLQGYGLWVAFAMSAFIYAGSMQYLSLGLLSGGASLLTIGLTTLMVNARHLFYGISLLDRYKNTGKKKPYIIFALTDETYSLVCSEPADIPQESHTQYYFLVSLFDQIYWVAGCVLGSVLGGFVNFDTAGMDFALTALFITIFTEQWLQTKNHLPAVTGVVVSVICLLIFGADSFLIPAMAGIAAMLIFMQRRGREVARHAE